MGRIDGYKQKTFYIGSATEERVSDLALALAKPEYVLIECALRLLLARAKTAAGRRELSALIESTLQHANKRSNRRRASRAKVEP